MAITHVASGYHSSANTTSAFTGSLNTTGVDLIVISGVYWTGGGGTGGVTDNKGNTYTALTLRSGGGGPVVNRLYYCAAPIVGTGHVLTLATTGPAIYPSMGYVAVSGAHAAPFHSENGSNGTSSPGSVTPPEAGCLIVTGVYHDGTSTIGSGFTKQSAALVGGSSQGGGIAYLIQGIPGAVGPAWSGGDASTIAVFLPAAPPPSGHPRAAAYHRRRRAG